MSFQMRGSLRGDFPRGGEASARFRMDDLRWNIEGWAGKKVYYRFRQALTKGFTSLSLENLVSSVNYAFVKWHATPKTTFTFGKHVLSLGGHEFDAVPVYVIQFSDFGSSFSSYQMGASAEWHISPSHDLVFQMSNFRGVSDSEFYYGQLPGDIKETNFPLIGTVNWNGDFLDDKSLKLRYSVSYGHQTTDKGVWIVSLGHSYRKPKLGGYIDLMWSRQGLDDIAEHRIPDCRRLSAFLFQPEHRGIRERRMGMRRHIPAIRRYSKRSPPDQLERPVLLPVHAYP